MQKRFVSIWFPHLSIDWFELRKPELKKIAFVSGTNKEERINAHIHVSNLIIQPFEIKSFTGLTFHSNEKLTSSEFATFINIYTQFEAIQGHCFSTMAGNWKQRWKSKFHLHNLVPFSESHRLIATQTNC